MNERLESKDNPYIKYLTLLRTDKKTRQEKQAILVSGIKLITDLAKVVPIETLIIGEDYQGALPCTATRILQVPMTLLKKITGLMEPEPLAAEIKIPTSRPLNSLKRLLILDQINDPGNLGTLFRTALALGWEGIFLTPGTVDPFNDKAIRASQGALLQIPFKQGSYEELFELLSKEKMELFLAEASGIPCQTASHPKKIALVLGNESRGIHPLLQGKGTSIAIPISNIDSLNVAIAGAILMYELSP